MVNGQWSMVNGSRALNILQLRHETRDGGVDGDLLEEHRHVATAAQIAEPQNH
jgi:hypothetical protein